MSYKVHLFSISRTKGAYYHALPNTSSQITGNNWIIVMLVVRYFVIKFETTKTKGINLKENWDSVVCQICIAIKVYSWHWHVTHFKIPYNTFLSLLKDGSIVIWGLCVSLSSYVIHKVVTPLLSWTRYVNKVCYPYITCHR